MITDHGQCRREQGTWCMQFTDWSPHEMTDSGTEEAHHLLKRACVCESAWGCVQAPSDTVEINPSFTYLQCQETEECSRKKARCQAHHDTHTIELAKALSIIDLNTIYIQAEHFKTQIFLYMDFFIQVAEFLFYYFSKKSIFCTLSQPIGGTGHIMDTTFIIYIYIAVPAMPSSSYYTLPYQ